MGEYLKAVEAESAGALAKAEQRLSEITKSKAWEATKIAADVGGIADPSPTADSISLAMSVAEKDWVGALLSGLSFVPYLGDALAKPYKLFRASRVVSKIEKEAAALGKAVDLLKSKATQIAQRKMAAASERARRAKEAAARCAKEGNIKGCNPWGTHLPSAKGDWKGERGNSTWVSKDGSVEVTYKDGYPDFKSSHPPSLHKDGGGEVEILQGATKNDFSAARDAMREKLGDPKWPGTKEYAPDGYTWHHKEDGVTMQLVNSKAHNATDGGASHTGGDSIVKSPQF